MTTAERLQAMELLWDALLHEPSDIEPPNWHRDILEQRMEKMNSPDAKYYSLEQLKERFSR